MQFFKYFWRAFAILFLLVGLTLFFGRQYFLLQATSQLEKDLGVLLTAKNSVESYQACLALGSTATSEDDPLLLAQLRFINDKEYQLEIVCQGLEFSPQVIKSAALPTGVVKAAGSSGVILTKGAWNIQLLFQPELMNISLPRFLSGRNRSLLVEDSKIVEKLSSEPIVDKPITTCVGYGFVCCGSVSASGSGQSRPAADCSDNCYQACTDRPIILAFTASGYDQYNRQLQLSRNTEATFFFNLGNQGAKPITAKIEFGDGQFWQGENNQVVQDNGIQHLYQCQTTTCQYQAKLSLTDANGVVSKESNVSTITVIVK